MRSFAYTLLVALSVTSIVSAHAQGPHHAKARNLKRAGNKKWGRRDGTGTSDSASSTATDAPDATTTYLSVVPDVVTGEITISNTAAAAPEATAAAVGADRGDTTPLPSCQARNPFGSYCDPTTTDCCETGTTCISNVCQRLCGIATTEPYCDADFPCDSTKGYVCTNSRCRPPSGATRVAIGSTCNQGGANTLFCIPGKAVCVSGTCQACTQHS
ncbi:hypothetical protein T439DRAFT_325015 [Meredithblackwellia eburnea MCA 4105]